MRLLLIEDDSRLGKAIYEGLREEYACDWFQNAEDGEAALDTVDYDIIVLDVGLPGMTGLELLAKLRRADNPIPVLLLTARDTPSMRVEGLDAGADDYLIKPFDFEELLARLRALLRRTGKYQAPVVHHKDIEIDIAGRIVSKSGVPVKFSNKEFEILRVLVDHAGQCLSKEQIEQKIYAWDSEFESNTVEVHISSIRRKLGKELITTIRGIGYIVARAQ